MRGSGSPAVTLHAGAAFLAASFLGGCYSPFIICMNITDAKDGKNEVFHLQFYNCVAPLNVLHLHFTHNTE